MQVLSTFTLVAIAAAIVCASNRQHVFVEHPDGYIVVDSFDPEFFSSSTAVEGGKDRRAAILDNYLAKKPAPSQQHSAKKPTQREDDPFASFKPREDSFSGFVSKRPAKAEGQESASCPASAPKKPQAAAGQDSQLESLLNVIFGLDRQTGYPAGESNKANPASAKAPSVGGRIRQTASDGLSRVASKVTRKEADKEDPNIFEDICNMFESSTVGSSDIDVPAALEETIVAEQQEQDSSALLDGFGDALVDAVAELVADMVEGFKEIIGSTENSEFSLSQNKKRKTCGKKRHGGKGHGKRHHGQKGHGKKGHGKKSHGNKAHAQKQPSLGNKSTANEDLLVWFEQGF